MANHSKHVAMIVMKTPKMKGLVYKTHASIEFWFVPKCHQENISSAYTIYREIFWLWL